MPRHKHADMIVEWAETGKEVQEYNEVLGKWKYTTTPIWSEYVTYRFKPKMIKYKKAFIRDRDGKINVSSVSSQTDYTWLCRHPSFVEWIDKDWREIEYNE